eukprot:1185683-Prorocentrum_minimum.AAC.1
MIGVGYVAAAPLYFFLGVMCFEAVEKGGASPGPGTLKLTAKHLQLTRKAGRHREVKEAPIVGCLGIVVNVSCKLEKGKDLWGVECILAVRGTGGPVRERYARDWTVQVLRTKALLLHTGGGAGGTATRLELELQYPGARDLAVLRIREVRSASTNVISSLRLVLKGLWGVECTPAVVGTGRPGLWGVECTLAVIGTGGPGLWGVECALAVIGTGGPVIVSLRLVLLYRGSSLCPNSGKGAPDTSGV